MEFRGGTSSFDISYDTYTPGSRGKFHELNKEYIGKDTERLSDSAIISLFADAGFFIELAENDYVDDVGNKIPVRFIFRSKDGNQIHEAIKFAMSLGMGISPTGRRTSGNKSFGDKTVIDSCVNGNIAIEAVPGVVENDEYVPLQTNQAFFTGKGTVIAGSSVSWLEIDQLAEKFGKESPFRITVPASLGGNAAADALGIDRNSLWQYVRSAVITDGKTIKRLNREELKIHSGLLGMTGAFLEFELELAEKPKQQFGYGVCIDENTLPKLVAALEEYTESVFENGRIISPHWKVASGVDGRVTGIEILSKQSLIQFIKYAPNGEAKDLAKEYIIKLESSGMEHMLYVTTDLYSEGHDLMDLEPIKILFEMFDERTLEENITFIDNASGLKAAKDVREGMPDTRRNANKSQVNFDHSPTYMKTTSTDIAFKASTKFKEGEENRKNKEAIVSIVWKLEEKYRSDVQVIADDAIKNGIMIEFGRYGHANLNASGLDPHDGIVVYIQNGCENNAHNRELVDSYFRKIEEAKKRHQLRCLNVGLGTADEDIWPLVQKLSDTTDETRGLLIEREVIETRQIEVGFGEKGKIKDGEQFDHAVSYRPGSIRQELALLSETPFNWTFRAEATRGKLNKVINSGVNISS